MYKKSYQAGFETDLVHRVAIYVPSCIDGRVCDQKQQAWTDTVIETFSNLFGGATAMRAHGYWKDVNGRIISEPVVLVYAYCTHDAVIHLGGICDLAHRIKEDMAQGTVAVEVDGALFLI